MHMLLEAGAPSRLQLPRARHKLVQEAEVAEVGLALHLHTRGRWECEWQLSAAGPVGSAVQLTSLLCVGVVCC